MVIGKIGRGGEGTVYEADLRLTPSSTDPVAVKVEQPTGDMTVAREWLGQQHLLQSLAHEGLVKIRSMFLGYAPHPKGQQQPTAVDGEPSPVTPDPGVLHRYTVMDRINGHALGDWLDKRLLMDPYLVIRERLEPLESVAEALDKLHTANDRRQPIAHGDVKPGNILVPHGATNGVLVDFGMTQLLDGKRRRAVSGAYAAPELHDRNGMCTPDADRYAFMVTVVHMLLGYAPPTRGDRLDLEQLRQILPVTALLGPKPILVRTLLSALSAAPRQRPRNLARWLRELLSIVSTSALPIDTADRLASGVDARVPLGTLRTPGRPRGGGAQPEAVPPRASRPPADVTGSFRILVVLVGFVAIIGGGVYAYGQSGAGRGASPTNAPSAGGMSVAHTTAAPPPTAARTTPAPQTPVRTNPATLTAAEGPSLTAPVVPPPPPVLYLSVTKRVQDSGDTMVFGPATILKTPYNRSIALCADGVLGSNRCANNGEPTWVEYTVSAVYRRLTGTIGLSSEAPKNCRLSAQVLADDTELFNQELQFGEAHPLDYKIGYALRIRLQMHALAGNGRCDLVFGDIALRK
ncbi:protein kinase domain-containing protein [Plantactinospora endophytica]|uniref:protein kinase domain-containing protein n=1 Tax=Plantactinospora endophytica TaxID=673535 RepID=UPI0019425381|nr:protein kinase [Plantactinospora endophytica]